MDDDLNDFNLLLSRVTDYMKTELEYSDSYIDRYKYGWRRIKFFLSINNYDNYKVDIKDDLIKYLFDDKNIRSFNDNDRLVYRSIEQLSEFVTTGTITKRRNFISKNFTFEGDIGRVIKEFADLKKITFKSSKRLFYHTSSLNGFCEYCKIRNISKFQDIDLPLLLDYISQIGKHRYANLKSDIPTLRQLMKFAFEQQILKKDFSTKIPVYRSIKHEALPSIYSIEEINLLLNSFQRNTKVGRRNYAIALLATHLGIRQSDISSLKFENLDWQKSTINFIQKKTHKPISLPLLPDIGNAIIDYLKYGRPISNEPYLFLTCRSPFVPFGHSATTHVIQRGFKKAGIDISKRKFGAHSLRHSLATRLLIEQTSYPVISQVLGHKNSNAAMVYLRIDLKALEICMGDVPQIPTDFYEQKGGVFYG